MLAFWWTYLPCKTSVQAGNHWIQISIWSSHVKSTISSRSHPVRYMMAGIQTDHCLKFNWYPVNSFTQMTLDLLGIESTINLSWSDKYWVKVDTESSSSSAEKHSQCAADCVSPAKVCQYLFMWGFSSCVHGIIECEMLPTGVEQILSCMKKLWSTLVSASITFTIFCKPLPTQATHGSKYKGFLQDESSLLVKSINNVQGLYNEVLTFMKASFCSTSIAFNYPYFTCDVLGKHLDSGQKVLLPSFSSGQ